MIGIIGRGANGARELLPRPLPLPLRTPAHVEGAHVRLRTRKWDARLTQSPTGSGGRILYAVAIFNPSLMTAPLPARWRSVGGKGAATNGPRRAVAGMPVRRGHAMCSTCASSAPVDARRHRLRIRRRDGDGDRPERGLNLSRDCLLAVRPRRNRGRDGRGRGDGMADRTQALAARPRAD